MIRCILLLLIVFNTVAAQPRLVLLKGNTVISRFSEGEKIRFRRKGDVDFYSHVITGIHTKYMLLEYRDTIYAFDIAAIDMLHHSNNSFHTRSTGGKLIAAGTALLLMVALNPNEAHEVSDGTMIVSSVFIGGGLIMKLFNNRFFITGRKRKIIVVGTNIRTNKY